LLLTETLSSFFPFPVFFPTTSLSHVLAKASELRFNILGYKGADTEISSLDDGNLVSSYESNSASCKFSVTGKFFLFAGLCEKEREREGHRHLGFGSLLPPVRVREGAPERSGMGSGIFSGEICHSFLRGEERMAAHGTPRKEVAWPPIFFFSSIAWRPVLQ
jgi:hypothetical protein